MSTTRIIAFEKFRENWVEKRSHKTKWPLEWPLGGNDIKSYFFIHVVSAIYKPLTVRYPTHVNNRVQFGK